MSASSTTPNFKKVKRSVPESGRNGQTKPSSSVGHTSAANSENPEEKDELVIDDTSHISLYKSGVCQLNCEVHIGNMRKHMKTVHSDYERCPSHGCYEYFKSGSGLDEHLAADHSSRVNCEFCGGSYGNERSLSVHVTRSHRCRQCGWSIYYYEREEHFNAQCRKCGAEFECALLMDQHIC